MFFFLFFFALIVGIGYYGLSVYNKIIAQIEAANNNKKQIDVQLDRRYKVFESLIEVVKKTMDFEKSTLKQVVELRSRSKEAMANGDEHGHIEAENAISRIAGQINVVFEQYPDLKSNQNALQLQEEIVNTENKLTFSKQAYNDSIEKYNATKKSFIESLIVGAFADKLDKEFEYWGLSDEARQAKEDYQVKDL